MKFTVGPGRLNWGICTKSGSRLSSRRLMRLQQMGPNGSCGAAALIRWKGQRGIQCGLEGWHYAPENWMATVYLPLSHTMPYICVWWLCMSILKKIWLAASSYAKNTSHSTNSLETIPRLRWGKEILEIINWLIHLPIYTGKMYKNAPSFEKCKSWCPIVRFTESYCSYIIIIHHISTVGWCWVGFKPTYTLIPSGDST